jgi:hypothetical protein
MGQLTESGQAYSDRYETNPLPEGGHPRTTGTVWWTDKGLKRIVRFRLVGYCWETPWWDVSYCYGEMQDGSFVHVQLPFHQLPRNWKGKLYEHAVKSNVFAKGMGFFDADVYSTLAG